MNSTRHILFVINGLGVGGAETHLIRLSKVFASKGYNVSILTISNDLTLLDRLDKRINHINIPLRKSLGLILDIKKILKIVKQLQPDLIHAHLFQANILSRLIKIFNKKIRIINTTHCIYDKESILGLSPYKLYRLTNSLTDFHTAVSQEALQRLINNKSINTKKSTFIANGLFVDDYKKVKHTSNSFKWIAVGRLIPVKNYKLLIKAFAKLFSNFSNIELHIAGEGEEKEKLIKLIEENFLEKKIKLLGNINNIPELLQHYNAFVISSNSEGLPMVLLEAMSASLPIVSTSVGEISNILNKSDGGYLAKPKNKNDLVIKMKQLMENKKVDRIKFGENNHTFVKENYDIDNLVNKWIDIYFN